MISKRGSKWSDENCDSNKSNNSLICDRLINNDRVEDTSEVCDNILAFTIFVYFFIQNYIYS